MQFVDRIPNLLGATSAILRERSELHNDGWFDNARRHSTASSRFCRIGQLYGYYGIMTAARHDFQAVESRGLTQLWNNLTEQFKVLKLRSSR